MRERSWRTFSASCYLTMWPTRSYMAIIGDFDLDVSSPAVADPSLIYTTPSISGASPSWRPSISNSVSSEKFFDQDLHHGADTGLASCRRNLFLHS